MPKVGQKHHEIGGSGLSRENLRSTGKASRSRDSEERPGVFNDLLAV
jgi:hypothetical protein